MGDYGPSGALPRAQPPSNPPLPSTSSDEISVLVTGFGPFKTNFINASWLIASSLPTSFDLPTAGGVGGAGETASTPRKVSITVHPAPIPVAYSAVRTAIPALLAEYADTHGGRQPDLVVHMGIAATRGYYSIETRAHRDSYHMSDNRGQCGYDDGEREWREMQVPSMLQAGAVDEDGDGDGHGGVGKGCCPRPPDDGFLALWKGFAGEDADVRVSTDAGRYLCEFIFFTSLALAWRERRSRNVVFLHVPSSCTEEDVRVGREVAVAMIKAVVLSWIDSR
ncbi:putative pyroglutamyl peptidase type I [Aspergillus campestris IBT 28561]|uniref:Pyroglutamyl peptidase type I n=1 Tax=Aspergillus campestris (strain IBT 28561) TaxID=1392248 RepID=A0A2I1CZT4_ASPC2|nr:putative pyroglutamyl peptidase type I [Aspergillus campestris IBT 28561]PKY03128.1 putative pyroglutamyl peptidase type I [Aspergillus campestris IBT 28561]